MEKVTVKIAEQQIESLFRKVLNGEEFLIMDKDIPVARLVPINQMKSYMERIRALYEDDIPNREKLSHEEYLKLARALRGSAPGIDTTVEREEDRV